MVSNCGTVRAIVAVVCRKGTDKGVISHQLNSTRGTLCCTSSGEGVLSLSEPRPLQCCITPVHHGTRE